MLKIAVSASGPELKAQVAPRFGRAPYFLIVNADTLDFEVVSNRQNLEAARGAGINAAALVAGYQPAAVMTGFCGPKAFETLRAAGIPVILGTEGAIRDAVAHYLTGQLTPAPSPNAESHWR